MATGGPTLKLASGFDMPQLGLGTWLSNPGEVAAAVKHAVKTGYRHIDCAAIYGNEPEIGSALKELFTDGTVKREDLFITSKLWNTKHNPEDVEPSCRKTLTDLGLEYLDLYLIHWPLGFERGDVPIPKNEDGSVRYDVNIHPTDTYLAMEKLVEKGLVRSIGVSNFNAAQITDILNKGKIKPASNQVECHPYFNQKKLMAFCKEKGITITAYSPLGAPARPWATADEKPLLEDPRLMEIAKKYGKSVAQVVIRWQIQRGNIVIPKSVNASRIEQNFAVFDFDLTAEDMAVVDGFNRPDGRIIVPMLDGKPRDAAHPHYGFNDEF